jgi:hypothetical protein
MRWLEERWGKATLIHGTHEKATLMLFFAKSQSLPFLSSHFPAAKKGFCITAGLRSVRAAGVEE